MYPLDAWRWVIYQAQILDKACSSHISESEFSALDKTYHRINYPGILQQAPVHDLSHICSSKWSSITSFEALVFSKYYFQLFPAPQRLPSQLGRLNSRFLYNLGEITLKPRIQGLFSCIYQRPRGNIYPGRTFLVYISGRVGIYMPLIRFN